MKNKQKSACLVLAALILLALPSAAIAADVDVFAEGAYSFTRTSPATEGKLVVYIYANINITDPLCSYGVKLIYDTARLGSPVAEKNTDVWYMGDASPGNTYMDPAVNPGTGEIIFIGGKLDTRTGHAYDGVTGLRVLLGKVTFTRSTNDDPKSDPNGPAGFFITELGLGKALPYDNFVTVSGAKKDGNTSFAVKIVEAGDATGNGAINAGDAQRVMQIYNGIYPFTVFGDCNLNGTVNAGDAQCVMQKYNGTYY